MEEIDGDQYHACLEEPEDDCAYFCGNVICTRVHELLCLLSSGELRWVGNVGWMIDGNRYRLVLGNLWMIAPTSVGM